MVFYAYLIANAPAYSAVQYIIFVDKVVRNVGNGYFPHLGTFKASSYLYLYLDDSTMGERNHIIDLLVDN